MVYAVWPLLTEEMDLTICSPQMYQQTMYVYWHMRLAHIHTCIYTYECSTYDDDNDRSNC